MQYNNEAIRKWIDALRSGDYEQGRGKLRNMDDQYCCLGVLCEVYQQEVGGLHVEAEQGMEAPHYAYQGDGAFPPAEVRDWVGFNRLGGDEIYFYHGRNRMLVELNDDSKLDFLQIADIIEEAHFGTQPGVHP